MRIFHLALLFCLTVGVAAAEERMSGTEFDAFTLGKTFTYGNRGGPYGAEAYLEDRRVRWSFLDGECKAGYWYDTDESLICFVYEDRPDEPQCWSFFMRDGRLVATFESNDRTTELYQIDKSDEPLMCHGPKIGV